MNQPSSHCHGWVDQLVHLSEVLEAEEEQNAQPHCQSSSWEFEGPNPPSPGGSWLDGRENINMDIATDSDPGWGLVDEFPGAARIFTDGRETFLNRFDLDTFSKERQTNLYYPFIKDLPISFRTGKKLRSIIELLPSGPKWWYCIMPTAKPTKSSVRLFFRDSVECLEMLFHNPLFHDKLDLVPFRVYRTAEHLVRIYSEWMTGDVAWDMQAARIGIMMNDPVGNLRLCYKPLACYIVNTPEACMLAGVRGKTSPVMTAMYKQFDFTLDQLQAINADPENLEQYFKAAQFYHLNGVNRPFWRDWPLSDPSKFFNPEVLHHWHKGSWDHDVKWSINIVGKKELDFRFSILQPVTGYRHFGEGISHLKKRYLIAVIAGAAPPRVVLAMHALVDFRYLGQAPELDDNDCNMLLASLSTFHDNKVHITKAGGRKGKKNIITNWYIPKLKLLQSVVPSIRGSGIPAQWTADITEHAHIVVIKNPACRSSNN
ncbi:hypothetical protein BU15DRAFT_67191 [Melanogaster broomeanus]|nr:hypothetical protein BU15DRAFT_67191 [Melanogaster broomeanus]